MICSRNSLKQAILLPACKQKRTDAYTASVRFCLVSGKDLEPKHLIPNMVPCQR